LNNDTPENERCKVCDNFRSRHGPIRIDKVDII